MRHVAQTSPPAQLARQLSDLANDFLAGALHPEPVATPDIEGARERRCDLFPRPLGYTFADTATRAWLASLFHTIAGSNNKTLPLVRFAPSHCRGCLTQ